MNRYLSGKVLVNDLLAGFEGTRMASIFIASIGWVDSIVDGNIHSTDDCLVTLSAAPEAEFFDYDCRVEDVLAVRWRNVD